MDKVKVKYYIDKKKYKVIEVDRGEVEKVKYANSLLWKEIYFEEKRKKRLEVIGISFCSVESYEKEYESIVDNKPNPEQALIMEEEKLNKKALISKIIKECNEVELNILKLRYYNNKTIREISLVLCVPKSTISDILERIKEKFRLILTKVAKSSDKHPQNVPINSEGEL